MIVNEVRQSLLMNATVCSKVIALVVIEYVGQLELGWNV